MIFYFFKMENSAGISRFVAHMKEEAQHTAAREADLPVIFLKTWQAKNLEFPLGRTCGIRLPATVDPLLAGAHELRRSV
jgi:hypothetical protein